MKQPLLIVVHPDSACGSADFNLGRNEATCQRLDMQGLVESWTGPMLVLVGGFADELTQGRGAHVAWGRALLDAEARNAAAGFTVTRLDALDPDHVHMGLASLSQTKCTPDTVRIHLTGAWYHSATEDGCVGAMRTALLDHHFEVVLEDVMDLDSSADVEADGEDDAMDDVEASEPATLPVPRHRPRR